MYRRLAGTSTACAAAMPACSLALAFASRNYRLIPHIDNEIEELAETQKAGRWRITHVNLLQQPLTRGEIMCDRLNMRERRRTGVLPEKSVARKLSQTYAKDGVVCEPTDKVKIINITIVGFDGHPFHFRLPPMPDQTLNNLIDGTGMCHGHSNQWSKCNNPTCEDNNHGDGCLVNVDIETLDRLLPPSRYEYMALTKARLSDRPDVLHNSRFSCQIPLTAELDGGLFAVKQYWSRSLRATATGWSEEDHYATVSAMRSKRVEPWAPLIEEPTKRDFAITWDMLWARSYVDILASKDADYKRKDGFHTRPQLWASYV